MIIISYFSLLQLNQSFGIQPFVPTDFSVTVHQNNNQLDWTNTNTIFTFTLVEKSTDQGDFYPIAYVSSNTNTYKDYSVSNGHVYAYRLKTFSGDVSSTYTNVLEAITLYPVNLNISSLYKNQVDLTWNTATLSLLRSPEYKTIVERRKMDEITWNSIAVLPITETSFRDTDVQDNTYYYYRVRMKYGGDRYSRYIPSDSGINTRTPYPLTTPLWGQGLPNGVIRLIWDMSKAGDGRAILERKTSTGDFTAIHTSQNSSFADTGRVAGETYTYRLCLQSANGQRSEYTNEIEITAEHVPTPSDFIVNAIASDQVVLSWSYPHDVETGFEIWRINEEEEDNLGWINVAIVPKNMDTYLDKTTSYGKSYTYKIRAFRGNTVFSDYTQNRTIKNTFPEMPNPLVYYIYKSALNIHSQDKVPENTIYTLEYRENPFGLWKDYKIVTDGYLTYYSKFDTSSDYYLRLRANTGNLESFSQEVHFFGSKPDSPTNISAPHIGNDRVLLKWNDNTEKERGYNIYRTVDGESKLIGTVNKDTRTFMDAAPLEGIEAYYEVRAYNLIGESNPVGIFVKTPTKISFKDTDSYQWAHKAIEVIQGMGAFDNIQSGYFYPQNAVTKGRLAHMIIKSFNINYNESLLVPLADITANHIYYKDLATAVNLGLMHPDSDGMINPQRAVTRKDVMLVIHNVLGHLGHSLYPYEDKLLEQFSDYGQIAPEDIQMIASFVGSEIISGKSGKRLDLSSYATKVEITAFIYRTLTKYKLIRIN